MKNYNNNKNVITKVSEKTNGFLRLPYIKLFGNKKLMVEGRCKIKEFDCNVVRLNCNGIKISVHGENLVISVLDRGAVVVDGIIASVNFDGETL